MGSSKWFSVEWLRQHSQLARLAVAALTSLTVNSQIINNIMGDQLLASSGVGEVYCGNVDICNVYCSYNTFLLCVCVCFFLCVLHAHTKHDTHTTHTHAYTNRQYLEQRWK